MKAEIGVLECWLDKVETNYPILPVDARAFRAHARLMHRKPDGLFEDAMITAVAQAYGLIVATRNVRDFAGFGVRVIDPFEAK